jgi:hypothetical protein
MTLPTPDTERGYRKPLYEAALAIWQQREQRFPARYRRMQPDNFDLHSGAFALVMSEADAAINKLRSLGFISDLGISAIEAERAMK